MKQTLILISAGAMLAIGCSKTAKPLPGSPSGVSLISGLTSISQSYDTNTAALERVTWNITGINPINILPTSYLGGQQLTFTGSNVTKLVYTLTNVPGAMPEGITINVTYNMSNQIDTLTLYHTTDTLQGNSKYAFQYTGTQISKVLVAHQAASDSAFEWWLPDTYYFVYGGANIVQINASIHYGTYSSDSNVYKYFIDTRTNNFAGSLPTYFMLNFIESIGGGIDDVVTYLPLYLNPNITDSIQVGYKPGYIATDTYKTIMDSTGGRISMRITGYATPYPDTTIFHY